MLIMGWFDYFLYTLPAIEVPGMVFIVYMMMKIGFKKNSSAALPKDTENGAQSDNT